METQMTDTITLPIADDNEISITDADLEEEEDCGCCGPVDRKKKRTAAPKPKGEPAPKKKKSPPKVTPIVLKQRKDAVDKRIQQLEVRIARDKELAKRYADGLEAAEAAIAQAAAELVAEGAKSADV